MSDLGDQLRAKYPIHCENVYVQVEVGHNGIIRDLVSDIINIDDTARFFRIYAEKKRLLVQGSNASQHSEAIKSLIDKAREVFAHTCFKCGSVGEDHRAETIRIGPHTMIKVTGYSPCVEETRGMYKQKERLLDYEDDDHDYHHSDTTAAARCSWKHGMLLVALIFLLYQLY